MGPRERQLFLRDRNPLFPAHRRMVTPKQILEAQSADAAELGDLHSRVARLVGEIVNGDRYRPMDAAKLLIDEVDSLQASCFGHGTQHALALAATLDQVATTLLTAMRRAQKGADFLSAFDKWTNARESANRVRFNAEHLLIERLEHADIIPTVCSMEPEAIMRIPRIVISPSTPS
jgi:hypothetical protein